ncbi:hypothetical protein [Altibacter sp.]|nr:hypothetical protein [Altibacter sp.]
MFFATSKTFGDFNTVSHAGWFTTHITGDIVGRLKFNFTGLTLHSSSPE